MKARRFDEVLEECLAAQLEGRRTVEESLSLYPSLAPELEPLLRAAASVTEVFQRASPPPYIVELGRERFLAAARARTSAGMARARHQGGPWGLRLWGAVGAAAAAALAAAAVGIAALLGSGGNEQGPASVGSQNTGPAPAVLNLSDWQQAHQHLKEAASRGAAIPQADLETIKAVTQSWKGVDPTTLSDSARQELEQAVRQQYETLSVLTVDQPGPLPPDEIASVLGITKEVAEKLGLELPTFSPAPSSPAGTPAPQPEPTATPSPASEPTPAPPPPSEGESHPPDPIFQPS
jgi:hypothetical protein